MKTGLAENAAGAGTPRSTGNPRGKIGRGNLLYNITGIGAEILYVFGLMLVGWVLSLLCGW